MTLSARCRDQRPFRFASFQPHPGARPDLDRPPIGAPQPFYACTTAAIRCRRLRRAEPRHARAAVCAWNAARLRSRRTALTSSAAPGAHHSIRRTACEQSIRLAQTGQRSSSACAIPSAGDAMLRGRTMPQSVSLVWMDCSSGRAPGSSGRRMLRPTRDTTSSLPFGTAAPAGPLYERTALLQSREAARRGRPARQHIGVFRGARQ